MFLKFRKPTLDELELIALTTAAVGLVYYNSPNFGKFMGAVAWNLGGKILTRACNKYSSWNIDEAVAKKAWDAPLNVATTTFLAAGVAESLVNSTKGFDVTLSTLNILSRSISYGIIGQVFKDATTAITDYGMPLQLVLKSKSKVKKRKKHEIPKHTILNNCATNFVIQHTKYSIMPSSVDGWRHSVQHVGTGFMKHAVAQKIIGGYATYLDAALMGALNFACYMVPLKILPVAVTSMYTVKSATVIAIEVSEKLIQNYTKGAPISGLRYTVSEPKKLKRE